MKNDTNITLSLTELSALLELKGTSTVDRESVEAEEDQDTAKDFLKSLWSALLKYWWAILASTVVFAVGMFALLSLLVPEYTATVQMYARTRATTTEETGLLEIQDIANAEYYVKLYGEYLKMDTPLQSILDTLNAKHDGKYADLTTEELYEMISFGTRNSTPIFYISITDTDPQRAVDIANIICEELPGLLQDALRMTVSPVTPIDWPQSAEDAELVSQQRILKTAIAAFVGLLLGCVFAYVKGCLLDDTIESSAWLSENFKDIPLLAEIPDISFMQKSAGYGEKKE